MQTIVYLVRHGQSLSNIKNTFTGQLNAELSELGFEQAKRVFSYFKNIKVDRVYSSDLIRAVDTVKPIADDRNLQVETFKELREIDGGKWHDIEFDKIVNYYKEDMTRWVNDLKNARCTGGESVAELGARVYDKVEQLSKKNLGKTIIIGTHATPVRAMISHVECGSVANISKVKWSPNASITKLIYDGQKFIIEYMGDSAHLDGLITELPKSV